MLPRLAWTIDIHNDATRLPRLRSREWEHRSIACYSPAREARKPRSNVIQKPSGGRRMFHTLMHHEDRAADLRRSVRQRREPIAP